MFYTIYKITNNINGKIYIGSHKTSNLHDGYMGSGKYLKLAQEKHGIMNFTKEILYVFDTAEEMYAKEAELVNENFLSEENTYNLKIGGYGGWDHINTNEDLRVEKNRLARDRTNEVMKEKYGDDYQIIVSSAGGRARCNKYPELSKDVALKGHSEGWFSFKGKAHTDAAKAAIGKANSESQLGEKNSQFGTRWIHSIELKMSKKVKKDDPLPDGWKEGRKIKF